MFLLKQLVKKGLGMSLGYILQRYEWDSSQLIEFLFHAGTNKSIELCEINYLCSWMGNKYILKWNFLFWSLVLWNEVDSVAEQLMNRRDSGLISLILLDQISNQMAFEIMTTVAF